MLSEGFGIFSGGVGIISVVLSLFRGFERFLGGGGIFSVNIFMCTVFLMASLQLKIFPWGV